MKTIIITGGHHNSALVVAKELVNTGFKVIWLGHRYAAKGDTNDSAEYKEVKAAGIPFHELVAGKLESTPTVKGLLNIPLGFLRSYKYLKQFKPDAVLSFGGYLGLSVSISAKFMGIPVYLHEQTLVPGRANIITAKFARRIYLTWQEPVTDFPKNKTQFVGLPLRQSILNSKKTKLFNNSLPTILVLGGKQGSHIINQHVFAGLPGILLKYNLIHQTGTSSVTNDYKTALTKKEILPPDIASQYKPVGYLGEDELGQYLASVDLVVGRSGAHTAYELALLGKRSVLIPFMHTTGSEQHRQAKLLESVGISIILPESKLTTPLLIQTIKDGLNIPVPAAMALPKDATERLVGDIVADLG